MDAGDLAPVIAVYAAELEALDHTRLTVANCRDPARHFAAWLRQADIALVDVNREVVKRFAQHVCRCGGGRRCEQLSRRYVRRARRFIAFLLDCGLIAPLAMPVSDMVDPHVADYQQWLKRHRGICESTSKRHGQMVMRLLTVLGHDPLIFDAGLIRRAILAGAQQCSPSYVKTMTTALRGYLRFLAAAGICPRGLERAVPLVPQRRLSSLPRYLSAADVDGLIASCDLGTVHGIRDRAILLLFARLGLRAGDVRKMQLDDIDWAAGTVLVSGKGRREVACPCPRKLATRCSPISIGRGQSSKNGGRSYAHVRRIDPSPALPRSPAWSAWHYGERGSRIRRRAGPTSFATRPRPPCCGAVRRFNPSAPCCGTVRSTRPRITQRSICRCSSRLESRMATTAQAAARLLTEPA
jgi:site-specific recombinase XerD